ncbi:B3/B4 domain-containing protein [Leuconostoc litchii]|uniref:B3/B4 domain-containing protein n=1 Tax=Leuconostoc litchii TaxID=1981069 RepID=UPI001FCBD1A3|nr:phenylalanine--tRNA ligase beta subunit-related protein [Leuconostoc litchii]
MKPLIVDSDFWEIFPEAQIFTLVVRDINNHTNGQNEKYQNLLNSSAEKAHNFLVEEDFKDNNVIAEWRSIFTKFKKKKGARSSIEALLKRVSQGKDFAPISPLVDIYNSVSLAYGVPCGGEDLENIKGTMHLGLASGGEMFYPLGSNENDPALTQEIIYYDEEGAICRSLNWRDAQRTMLTDKTKNAILVIESIMPDQRNRSLEAIQELKRKIEDNLGVAGTISILSKNDD